MKDRIPLLPKIVEATRAQIRASWLLAPLALLFCFSSTLLAQSALDGFDPNANGLIRVVVTQPDGKILIGGDFTTVAPNGSAAVTRNRVARLNADGTLDNAFNPNASEAVAAIAVQADGKIVVGGFFNGVNSIGGQTRNYIARLDAATGLADSFDPNANSTVRAFAIQADGKILVGGSFGSIGGQTRTCIARLDPATGAADSFAPNAAGGIASIQAITLQANGKIIVGGIFTTIGGQPRNRIARLDPATGLADSFNPNANNAVRSIAVQADGKIIAAGSFNGANSIGGQTRNRIARLDPTTGLADSFDPNAPGLILAIYAVVVQPDGKILAGGEFTTIGGQTRNYLARLDPATGLADSFNPNANGPVFAIAVQSDGKILAGGPFDVIAGGSRRSIARLDARGRLDQTLNCSIVGSGVYSFAVQPDGKVIIGGTFTSVCGVPRNNIARLNADGTLDLAFDPNAQGPADRLAVYSVAVQPDGKILAGGEFLTIGGQPRSNLARLDATTGTADSFTSNANLEVLSITVLADGKVLVGGSFTTIGGQTRNRFARLDGTSGAPDAFHPNADVPVITVALQQDGKILVGGNFDNIGGQPRRKIARLDPVSGLADTFNPEAQGNYVFAISVQPDGKVLVGGEFTAISGQPRGRIARLDPVTGAADSFNPNVSGEVGYINSIVVLADNRVLVAGGFRAGTNSIGGQARNSLARLDPSGAVDSFDPMAFNPNASSLAYVDSLAVQDDGKILAGGIFTTIGGQARDRFARLSNDTAALQSLTVTPGIVTWTRGGSSPSLTRVTFEYSTDNVNYTLLGAGTASGSNWTLSGLSLPIGQNFFVRARGHYRSGIHNGSESITESVKSAFLHEPLLLATAVSRKTHGGAGSFDVPLPLTGEPGVECRSSGGAHTLVVTFSNEVMSGNASVSAGTGSVSGAPAFSSNTMTVNLADVADVQKITLTLSNVTDSFGQVLPNTAVSMNILAGDVNGSKSVSASDIGAVKAQSGLPVNGTNFRADVAVSGSITASDIGLVKARSGQSVP